MNQPTFSEGPPVPMMVEGILDRAMVVQLSSDWQANTVVLSVIEKGFPMTYALAEGLPLDAAVERLLSGKSRGFQVRYRYEGKDWTDTILAIPTGYKLVRCQHD